MSSYGMPNILVNNKFHDARVLGRQHKEVHCVKKKCMTQGCQDKKQVNHCQLMWIVQAYFAKGLEVLAHVHK